MLYEQDKFRAQLLSTIGHKVGRFILNTVERENEGEYTKPKAVERISNVLADLEYRLSLIEFGKSTHEVIREVLTVAVGMLQEAVQPWYEGVNNDDEFARILEEQDEE